MSELKETAFSRFVEQYEKYNGSAVNDDNSFTSDFTIYTFAQYERLLNTRPNDAKEMIGGVLDNFGAIPESTQYAKGWNDCRKELGERLRVCKQSIEGDE